MVDKCGDAITESTRLITLIGRWGSYVAYEDERDLRKLKTLAINKGLMSNLKPGFPTFFENLRKEIRDKEKHLLVYKEYLPHKSNYPWEVQKPCCENGAVVRRVSVSCCSTDELFFSRNREPIIAGHPPYDPPDPEIGNFLRALISYELADIVFEYLGRRLAFLSMSGLWKHICDEHGDNYQYALRCTVRENPVTRVPEIYYARKLLRAGLLTYELTNFIFIHLENIAVAMRMAVQFKKKLFVSLTSLSRCQKEVNNDRLPGTHSTHGKYQAELLAENIRTDHRIYVREWTFIYDIIDNLPRIMERRILPKLIQPPHSLKGDHTGLRKKMLGKLAEDILVGHKKEVKHPMSTEDFILTMNLPTRMRRNGICTFCSPCPINAFDFKGVQDFFKSVACLDESYANIREGEEPSEEYVQRMREFLSARMEAREAEGDDTETDSDLYEEAKRGAQQTEDHAPIDEEYEQPMEEGEDPGEVLAQSPTIDPIDLTDDEQLIPQTEVIDLTDDNTTHPLPPSSGFMYRMDML